MDVNSMSVPSQVTAVSYPLLFQYASQQLVLPFRIQELNQASLIAQFLEIHAKERPVQPAPIIT